MPKRSASETVLYPVVIHREDDVWGYASPEFGGGGAATFQEAIRLATELVSGEVARIIEEGGTPPAPPEGDLDADGGQVAWLPVSVATSSERIFLTLPKTLIARIDAATANRSAFFAELARERLGSS